MPYIAIKAFPKDEAVKTAVVDKIFNLFLDEWGCPPQAVTISVEEFAPNTWEDSVVKPEINQKLDRVLILNGEKKY